MTVNHSKVVAAYTNFPMLLAETNNAQLKNTASNGHVSDTQGSDIFFEATSGALLDFEIEQFDGASGTLIAWIEIPVMSSSQDLSFWLRYGAACPCVSKANPAGVWEGSDEAVYHLDHDFKDSTTSGRNGTPYGSPPFVSGRIGHGASFNGTSQYIDTQFGNGTAGLIPQWTVSCWVLGTTDPGSAMDTGPVMHESNFNIGWHHTDANYRRTAFFATATNWFGASFDVLTHGTWYYLAGTYDGTTLTAYKNGVMTQQVANISSPAVAEPTTIKIGRHGVTPTWYFDGQVDEVRVSSTAHSAGWIATSYNNQASPATFYTLGSEEALW